MSPIRVLEPEVTDIDLTATEYDAIGHASTNVGPGTDFAALDGAISPSIGGGPVTALSRRASKMRRAAPALLLLALAAIGCESKPDVPSKGPPPLPPRPTAAASGDPAAVEAGSAAPTASVALAAPTEAATAGTWEGSYDAKKGAVVLPDRVKDKTRTTDDSKLMIGPGKVELTVTAAGDVRGKATGALGEATLTGKLVDEGGGFLRASWYPEDASKPNAMTGVLYGPLKDGVITAMIRVAGPDAVLVREAKIELKKR